jgi:hypothetical protein
MMLTSKRNAMGWLLEEPVRWRFCAFILKGNIERVLKLNIKNEVKEPVVKAIQQVLAVHEEAIRTGEWSESAAKLAELATQSAAKAKMRSLSYAWSPEDMVWARWLVNSAQMFLKAETIREGVRLAAESEWAGMAAADVRYAKYAEELLRLVNEASEDKEHA